MGASETSDEVDRLSVVALEPVAPATAEPPRIDRDGHKLTPIEATSYDELSETGLVFAVQATVHSTSRTYRPDFIVYPANGRPRRGRA